MNLDPSSLMDAIKCSASEDAIDMIAREIYVSGIATGVLGVLIGIGLYQAGKWWMRKSD